MSGCSRIRTASSTSLLAALDKVSSPCVATNAESRSDTSGSNRTDDGLAFLPGQPAAMVIGATLVRLRRLGRSERDGQQRGRERAAQVDALQNSTRGSLGRIPAADTVVAGLARLRAPFVPFEKGRVGRR